jgi:hypothetical protein
MTGAGEIRRVLLEDGSLALSAAAGLEGVLAHWLPLLPLQTAAAEAAQGWLQVDWGAVPRGYPGEPPTMDLYAVQAWVRRAEGRVVLADPQGVIGAEIDLGALRAVVRVAPGAAPPLRSVFATFTICAGVLLNRMGRALVHGAGVAAPGGGAWVLPGSSFSGKSSTTTTLIGGGWNYLSDDHVVLARGEDGVPRAEGWPRPFFLDTGYAEGRSSGVRVRSDPARFSPGQWRRRAPLSGFLFPRVEAEAPTRLQRLHPAQAFVWLLRQSPWILADPEGAPPVRALLEGLAALPAYELRLGQDSYCNAERLQLVLEPLLERNFAAKEGADA